MEKLHSPSRNPSGRVDRKPRRDNASLETGKLLRFTVLSNHDALEVMDSTFQRILLKATKKGPEGAAPMSAAVPA